MPLARPARFLVAGVANTVLGLAVIYSVKWLFDAHDAVANVIGYGVGLACNFLLNKTWTFRHTGPHATALLRFLLVFVVAYLLNLATLLLAIYGFGVNGYLAQALGVVPYTVFTYVASRDYAFR